MHQRRLWRRFHNGSTPELCQWFHSPHGRTKVFKDGLAQTAPVSLCGSLRIIIVSISPVSVICSRSQFTSLLLLNLRHFDDNHFGPYPPDLETGPVHLVPLRAQQFWAHVNEPILVHTSFG